MGELESLDPNTPLFSIRHKYKEIDWNEFPGPPKDLSPEDQAFWWEEWSPGLIRSVNRTGLIPPEVLELILQSLADKALAEKIKDRKKSSWVESRRADPSLLYIDKRSFIESTFQTWGTAYFLKEPENCSCNSRCK